MKQNYIEELLEAKYLQYNQKGFIEHDPIRIPHLFSKKQDIEIMGFIAAVLAWGQRVTIINKCKELVHRMDNAPYDFILNHRENDLKKLLGFKHRTFNDTDLLYFVSFLNHFYKQNDSLENAFVVEKKYTEVNTKKAIVDFHNQFFSMEYFPERTRKHVSTPLRKSACKRINMYLRWMVRKDENKVDFGLWTKIKPAQLICPCDVHVDRVARGLGLLKRTNTDWEAAVELTENLKQFDPLDPVKYDFALFGMGVEEKF